MAAQPNRRASSIPEVQAEIGDLEPQRESELLSFKIKGISPA